MASRNLIRYFLKLSNPSRNSQELENTHVHVNHSALVDLVPLADYSYEDAMYRLQHYKKVVFLRHPVDRLLSAWNDKLYNNDTAFEYLRRAIIATCRYNSSTNNIDKITKDGPVTLLELFQFLNQSLVPTKYWNEHWKPMNEVCQLCFINYDYIGKIEYFSEEVAFIVEKVMKIESSESIPPLFTSPPIAYSEHRLKELAKLPTDLFNRVMAKYERDFQIGGYSYYQSPISS